MALILFLFVSLKAQAVITITAVGGTSYNETDANKLITTVYGGIAGTCTTTDNASTCNSCVNTAVGSGIGGIQACNLTSVYATLPISISFTSDKVLTNAIVKIQTEVNGGTTPGVEIYSGTITAAANTVATVSTTWGQVCDPDDNFDSNCAPTDGSAAEVSFATSARKLYLQVDEDLNTTIDDATEQKSFSIRLHYVKDDDPIARQNFCNSTDTAGGSSGMCGFKLGVGDEKLYLQEIYGVPTTISGLAWYGIALAASTSSTDLTPNNAGLQVHPYSGTNYYVDDNTITGLENYQTYCVLMGNVDKAQNIYKFNLGGTGAETCAAPSEVLGLLSDKSCFISTAAFGSDMANQVQLLRKFRDQYLIPHMAGRAMVKFYYKISPPLAHFIERSEFLKAFTRALLYPVIAGAWLLLNYEFLVMLFGVAALLYFIKRRVRHA